MPPVVGTNYVLNLYIHKIMVQKQICCIDENHETCVSCKFLEKITFDICQPNDPRQQNSSCACVIKFEKGKTCLFLMSADMVNAGNDMNLYMDIWQKMSCACLPSKLPLGNTKIDLSDQFTQVNGGSSVKPMKGYYPVKSAEGEEIAVVDMMIRLSKLNDVNLNDFTMNDAGNNFMIKGNDDPQSYMFKRAGVLGGKANNCDPAKMVRDLGAECCSDKGHSPMGCGGLKGGGGGFGGEDFRGSGGGGGGGGCCGTGGGGTTCTLPRAPSEGCGCFGQNKEILSGGSTGGEFEEIGATLNGNQIKIRVPRSKGSKGSGANLLPPTEQKGTAERTMVFGQNEILLSMRQGGPGEGSGGQQEAFTTKFAACGDPNEGKPTMAITPSNVPHGVEAMKVIHPNKDVFLLRINKKCRMADKANLELELVTPKPPEKPPKPQSESRNTQYDEHDIPQPPPPPPEPEPEPVVEPPVEDTKKGKGKKGAKEKGDKKDGKKGDKKGGKKGKK